MQLGCKCQARENSYHKNRKKFILSVLLRLKGLILRVKEGCSASRPVQHKPVLQYGEIRAALGVKGFRIVTPWGSSNHV